MKQSLQQNSRMMGRCRGVTLVEMLVTLAVLLLMMTVIVQIFQAATGALNAAQVYQELDNQLRLLDSTIRSDLSGVTCRMTPPNDPRNNLGYFEYGENEFADVQGEDSDDYLRFTSKAPAGRPFTGRMWIGTGNQQPQPISITSEYAEIIYFLRNGNLYRRVLLVVPQRQGTIVPTVNNLVGVPPGSPFTPVALGSNAVSWQGVNDLSAHPLASGSAATGANAVVLNSLADLTNRENRAFYQRFSSDFQNLAGVLNDGGDGLADDYNGDNVPDYYPTLYPTVLTPVTNPQLIFEPTGPTPRPALAAMAFPFLYPRAYSVPQMLSSYAYGWIHSPNPQVNVGTPSAPVGVSFEGNLPTYTTLDYLHNLNHNPLDTGDNLSIPAIAPPNPTTGYYQTWWGFPTWRETLSPSWNDPTFPVNGLPTPFNLAARQPLGLSYHSPNTSLTKTDQELVPDMTSTSGFRTNPQLYNDGFGSATGFFTAGPGTLWSTYSWEDDLIMTGVRSFDVKAYDNTYAGYVDLGWGDDLRLYGPYLTVPGFQFPGTWPSPPGLASTPSPTLWPPINPAVGNGRYYDTFAENFAHEGRLPPLVADNRFDAQYGQVPAGYYPAPNNAYTGNVGDDNPAVARLRRVWDSWSTGYSTAPATGIYLNKANAADPLNGFPWGPPFTPPIYPSYPPPYPAPLRGIQIQIRVTDPTSQRIKSLTIRQDFTDKL